MTAQISSFLEHKVKREIIKPMYANINMLSDIFRRQNFKVEMKLLTTLFENFEVFAAELEKNDWDKKKVPKQFFDNVNQVMDQLSYRAKVRNQEFGL